ncbi:lysophospholipid acyltransferase family protein [Aurantimonas marina]|uniref:lysophospholipid acyltransferase family protein n=1 Tax=Aurantimonas marina TaxID=2780508 RepID=UPI001E60A2C8|nr:lysophospholipid acyltransferase family protein [Aurantimonas marina]
MAGETAGQAVPLKRSWLQAWQRRWRRMGREVVRSRLATMVAGAAIYRGLCFVRATQKEAPGSSDWARILDEEHPAIVGLWHGQHLLAPFFRPAKLPYAALLSRNADAEINAMIVERFGIATVRGSGGRAGPVGPGKGGARALIALRRFLANGFGVCMIADVPKGTPRKAGLGIVMLARITGRPVLPSAAVTSRRYVVASSWDKTTIPLPFGRIAVVVGAPISVPADADDAMMESKRREITRAIEAANEAAERLARDAP